MCSSSFGSEVESFALPKAPEQVWESTASPKKTHLASASKGVPLPGVETRVQQYRIHLLNGSTSAVSRGKLDGCQLHLFSAPRYAVCRASAIWEDCGCCFLCGRKSSNWPAPSDEHLSRSSSDSSTRLRSRALAQQLAKAGVQGGAGTQSSKPAQIGSCGIQLPALLLQCYKQCQGSWYRAHTGSSVNPAARP